MLITLVSIGAKGSRGKRELADQMVEEYLQRSSRYAKTAGLWAATEEDFWSAVEGAAGRAQARAMLMESSGRALTSGEFAGTIGEFRDRGAQQIFVAIGGADGWSPESRKRADVLVSMGRMTLPHSLARVFAAEQIYRAMTILAGHPYHCGH